MTAAAPESGGKSCRELHREIYDLHNDVVSFYKRVEQLNGFADLAVANEFRYALRQYLDANQYSLGLTGADEKKEMDFLLQTRYQLLILHHDMIDFVEAEFRDTFDRMMRQYDAESVGKHVNIPEFHRDLSAVGEIIAKSRSERDNRHKFYLEMAKAGGIADKMLANLKLLLEVECYISADARKLAWKNPWAVRITTAIMTAVISVLLSYLFLVV
ncbi:MAG: hypothetical protein ACR2P4_02640 [Gammaproteobacteria bacterium]